MRRRSSGQAVRRTVACLGRGLGTALVVLTTRPPARLTAQAFEQRLLAIPDTGSARRLTYDLARVPHVAGTPAQAATRDYVIDRMRAWGLETWTKEYTVY
ncbi:MAG TPA: hypothetical protein VEK86_00290, partial [Gemmatimonadales bacterium]|nr:hypothetical protein [Gemmatimonadales bacterium]